MAIKKRENKDKNFNTEEESEFLTSETSDNYDDDLEDELAAEEAPKLPKDLDENPNRLTSLTPQKEKLEEEGGEVVEIRPPHDKNLVVRKVVKKTQEE